MAILRWNKASKMTMVRNQTTRLFDYALSKLNIDIRTPSPWLPSCDVFETSNKYVLKMEVPGLLMQDLVLEVSGASVIIMGHRRRIKEVEEENFHRIERSFGRFVRDFVFPQQVGESGVKADLSDGVLTITLPKERDMEKTDFTKIDVK